ncbi:MAG: hypothetical protein AABX38_05925 [Candidatus Micrarchaeota archaeon]
MPNPICSGFMCNFEPSMLGGLAPDMQWFVIALTASILIVIIHATILAFSRALNMNELERYAKSEILNAVATSLMVIFLVSTLGAMESFALNSFLGCGPGGTNCPTLTCGGSPVQISDLKSSVDLLKCRLSDKAAGFAQVQQQIIQTSVSGNPFSVFNRLQFYLGLMGVPIFSGQYVTAWFKEAETYRLLNSFITTFLIGSNTLIVAAEYVKNNMLSFYLPVGLLLRAFPYTRGIGAFFIALALGMYFVYPVLYIITDPGFVKPSYTPSQAPPASGLCYPTFSSISFAVSSQNTLSPSGGSTDLSASALASDLSQVYTSLLLQPFIVFAMTMVFVRYATYIFGGEPADILRAVAKVV